MEIIRSGESPSQPGPSDYFTGAVEIASLPSEDPQSRVAGVIVSFEAGARTAWHTHPLGQMLLVTAGEGWAQRDGGPRQVIRAGDVVWFPAGQKHWHGATADSAMTHYAVAAPSDGETVNWLEQVSDAQYLAGTAPRG